MRKCYCLAPFLAAQLHAQDDARDLIHRVVTTMRETKSIRLEIETDSDLIRELNRSLAKYREVIVWDEATGRLRFESSAPSGIQVVVSDGKQLLRADLQSREYVRTPVAGKLFETKGGGQRAESYLRYAKAVLDNLGKLEDRLIRADVLGKDYVEIDARRIDCVVVRADYSPPPGANGLDFSSRTFWIDPQRNIVVREDGITRSRQILGAGPEPIESQRHKRYLSAAIGEALDDNLFAYVPARNLREVDQFSMPGPRPAISLTGKAAPELALNTLSGTAMKLSELRGKIVLLDFWATWCGPCRTQMETLAKLHAETKEQGVVLLGVDDDADPEVALKYMKEKGYAWESLFDGPKKVARTAYGVMGIPTLVLIDREGVVRAMELGSGQEGDESMREALRKLGVALSSI